MQPPPAFSSLCGAGLLLFATTLGLDLFQHQLEFPGKQTIVFASMWAEGEEMSIAYRSLVQARCWRCARQARGRAFKSATLRERSKCFGPFGDDAEVGAVDGNVSRESTNRPSGMEPIKGSPGPCVLDGMSRTRLATAARVIAVALLLVVGGCAHREARVPPTDPRRAYPDGHEEAEEEARSRRSLASFDRHRPPDCSHPAHPCSEVGSGGDLLTGDDEPAIGRRRDYLAEYNARRGSLSSEAVEAALKENRGRFKACGLAGTALVRIVVKPDGGVGSAKMERATLSEGTGDCLLDAVKNIRFPQPEAAAELLVPFVFRSR